MLRFFAFVILALVAACSRPQDDVRSRLSGVDTARLRLEAARLYVKVHASPSLEYRVLNPVVWPEAFKKLKPLRVGCYRDGFTFIFGSTSAGETGLLIQPTGMDKIPVAEKARYERISEGIFLFEPKR